MSKVAITNRYESELVLPNGQRIGAGKTAMVDGWNLIEKHNIVEAWIRAKVIEVADEQPTETGDNGQTTPAPATTKGEGNNAPAIGATTTNAPAEGEGAGEGANEPAWKKSKKA